jgi:ribosome-associated protein
MMSDRIGFTKADQLVYNPPMQPSALQEQVHTLLADQKATDIVTLDVRAHSNMMDYLMICTGRSSRHVIALGQHLMLLMKEHDQALLGVEGLETGEWVLIDLGDIVVHIMQQSTRAFYDLETLWTEMALQTVR